MVGTHASRAFARTLLAAAAALLALTVPATAAPVAPDVLMAAPLAKAQELSRTTWGADACNGQVEIRWQDLKAGTNAISSWTNPVGQYDAPAQNGACAILFNSALPWDWAKFCSVVVHEYGHLTGHPHAALADDVMYAFYVRAIDPCVAAGPELGFAEPIGTDAAALVAPPATPAAAAPTSSTAPVVRTAVRQKVVHERRGATARAKAKARARARAKTRRHRAPRARTAALSPRYRTR
jgi:hypothetical protein